MLDTLSGVPKPANDDSKMFVLAPVSLWVEYFSAVKHLLDQARAAVISDFRVFTDVHPEFVERRMQEITRRTGASCSSR